MDISEIDTPAVVIDLDALESNIEKMARHARRMHCNLRPHIKVHKSPAIANKQVASGAIGVTCAKLGEAEVMATSGLRDILIANQIVGAIKVGRLVDLSRHANLMVAIDNPSNAEEISKQAMRRETSLGAVIEVDVGMGRAGVPPGKSVVSLARSIKRLRGLHFRGIMGYEGHLQQIDSFEERSKLVRRSLRGLTESAKLLKSAGFEVEIVSTGGTNTYNIASTIEGVTEIQPGSYVFMDVEHDIQGIDFKHALTVLSTVTSRPDDQRSIIDAGLKCFADSKVMPKATMKGVKVWLLSEEHGWLKTTGDAELRVGDRLEFYPYYAPTTVNLYEKFYCVRKGRVEAEWPILGRGRSQ